MGVNIMQVTKIANNMNFGLKRTDACKKMENILESEQKKKLTEAKLDYSSRLNSFVLQIGNDFYDVGKVNKKLPFATLATLYKNLSDFDGGDGSGNSKHLITLNV